jgi:transposase
MAERSSSPHPTQRRYPPELRERAVRLVREVATEQGERTGLTTAERARIKELERDNRELRRANEILKSEPRRQISLSMHVPREGAMPRATAEHYRTVMTTLPFLCPVSTYLCASTICSSG